MIFTDLADLTAEYRHLYLSPHLDDAALSCGGLIAGQVAAGDPVLVVTLCTAAPPADADFSPLARSFHQEWGLPPAEVVAARLAEERAALATLGADGLWAGMLDAIYRAPAAYDTRATLFGAPAAADPLRPALTTLVGALRDRFPRATIYAPLGVGHHVDHQLTCAAAMATAGERRAWYEDFPYVARAGELERRLAGLGRDLRPASAAVDGAGMAARRAAVDAYASQLAELAHSQLGRPASPAEASALMAAAIDAYARSVAPPGAAYGERIWRLV